MNKFETFQQYLTNQTAHVSVAQFVINLSVAAVLSYLLGVIYIKYGQSLSNRKQFASNFVILTMTTMLIITVVKSSLALSLGLVGALSIVRFRAAIKEPEELAYLFLTIAIGLALGAGQLLVTLVATPIFAAVFIGRGLLHRKDSQENLFLSISSNSESVQLNEIIRTLNESCESVDLRRYDESQTASEATFQVQFSDHKQMQVAMNELRQRDPGMRIVFVDSTRMAA